MRTMKNPIGLAFASAILALAGTANAATITVTPTGTSADYTAVSDAITTASPGDVIILANRAANSTPTAFNFSAMTSNGIVIDTPFITIKGQYEAGPPTVATTIQGPGSFDAENSDVTFTLNTEARGVTVDTILFENFEAAVVLEKGVQEFTMKNAATSNCANGIYGVGDNDRLWVDGCIFSIASTPLGGNGGVTIQEGSDRATVVNSRFKGPGVAQASLVVSGIIDFNIGVPGSADLFANNVVRNFDVGIYASSSLATIHCNTVQGCSDGIALVSEVSSGSSQGNQRVVNAVVTFNVASGNVADGIDLQGVLASTIADNNLSNNGDEDVNCGSTTLGTGAANNKLTRNTGSSNCGAASLSTRPRLAIVLVRP